MNLSHVSCEWYAGRAHYFPLLDGPGQVKLPVGQVDLSNFCFFILYKQIEELQNSIGRAKKNLRKGECYAGNTINMFLGPLIIFHRNLNSMKTFVLL